MPPSHTGLVEGQAQLASQVAPQSFCTTQGGSGVRLWGICSLNPCFEVGRQTASHAFPGRCISSCSGGSEAGYVPLPAPVPCTGRPHTCAWQWDKCSWSRRDCQPHRWPAAESARAALSSSQPRHAVSQPRHASPRPREIYGPTGRARSSSTPCRCQPSRLECLVGRCSWSHTPHPKGTQAAEQCRGGTRVGHMLHACAACLPLLTYCPISTRLRIECPHRQQQLGTCFADLGGCCPHAGVSC